jgi:hypothetical protein
MCLRDVPAGSQPWHLRKKSKSFNAKNKMDSCIGPWRFRDEWPQDLKPAPPVLQTEIMDLVAQVGYQDVILGSPDFIFCSPDFIFCSPKQALY